MLMYLTTVLTETFLLPMLWAFLTRLMRYWTFLLVFRDLLDNGTIADQALNAGKSEREFQEQSRSLAHAVAADTVGPDSDGTTGARVRLDNPSTAAKDAAWMQAAEKWAEEARRKFLARRKRRFDRKR